MKIYDQRVSKGLSVSSAALLAVVFYLLLDMCLNLLQSVIDPTGESYNTIYGIVQFIVVTLYWVIINYILFSKAGRTGRGAIFIYMILNLLPILVFTIATCVIIEYFPTTEFTLSWNLLTWIIAPTLFWYFPFSYVYFAFGYYISIPIFMAIVLTYTLCVQCVGIILGLARRAHITDKEKALKRQRERARQAQAHPQVSFETGRTTVVENEMGAQNTQTKTGERLYTGTNPFREKNTEQIIYTEAFETITDDMLENAANQPQETYLMNEKIDKVSVSDSNNLFKLNRNSRQTETQTKITKEANQNNQRVNIPKSAPITGNQQAPKVEPRRYTTQEMQDFLMQEAPDTVYTTNELDFNLSEDTQNKADPFSDPEFDSTAFTRSELDPLDFLNDQDKE